MGNLEVYSPITLEKVGDVTAIDPDDIENVISECRSAQQRWKEVPKDKKLALLKELRSRVISKTEEIAKTIHLETGKPRMDAQSTEVMPSAAMVSYCEHWLKRWHPVSKIDQGPVRSMMRMLGRRSYLEYRPLGVIGIISPFNFPFSIPFTQAVTAVTAGNGVVVKPSDLAPMSAHMMEELFREAGFPEGLVKAVSGSEDIGPAVSRSSVDKIILTGGGGTGRCVIRQACDTLTPTIMELGGKDAMIVLADADIERAASCAVWGSFVNSGQVCAGIKRIYVQDSVYDRFTELYVQRTGTIRQGDGWNDPEVSVGPLISQRALDDMTSVVRRAAEEGGRILTGGKRNEALKGYFFEPTIIEGLDNSSGIVKEEIFGPVVTMFRFSTEEEAIAMANDSRFALCGSVWTKDLEKGKRVASKINAGTVNVNNSTYTYGLPATPWGGSGESGYGTTHGNIGFLEMMHPHHVHVDAQRYGSELWWMPYSEEKAEVLEALTRRSFGGGRMSISVLRRALRILKGKE